MRMITAVAGILLVFAACEDHLVGPGAPLPVVSDFEVDEELSDLDEVVLVWEPLEELTEDEFDGYRILFRWNDEGDYQVLGEVAPDVVEYSHLEAPCAGGYAIEAFRGELVSSSRSVTGTMPVKATHLYTIWNDAVLDSVDTGIHFNESYASTGQAGASGFDHDLYCHDGGEGCATWLYSGNFGPHPIGSQTLLFEASSSFSMPEGASELSMPVSAGEVLLGKLQARYYIKIYVMETPEYPGGPADACGIRLYYDYQPIQDLYLFTTDSLP